MNLDNLINKICNDLQEALSNSNLSRGEKNTLEIKITEICLKLLKHDRSLEKELRISDYKGIEEKNDIEMTLAARILNQILDNEDTTSILLKQIALKLDPAGTYHDLDLVTAEDIPRMFPKVIGDKDKKLQLKKKIAFLQRAIDLHKTELIVAILKQGELKQGDLNKKQIYQLMAYKLDSEEIMNIGDAIGDSQFFNNFAAWWRYRSDRNLPKWVNKTHWLTGPKDGLLLDPLNTTSLQKFERLLKGGYPINEYTISLAFFSQNYRSVALVLKYAPEQLFQSKDTQYHIFNNLQQLDDPKMGEVVLKYLPGLPSLYPAQQWTQTIADGSIWFAGWVLDHGLKLDKTTFEKGLDAALENFNLPLIKKICQHADKVDGLDQSFSYPQVLDLESLTNPQKIASRLASYALMSPARDLYQLVESYPQFVKYLPKIMEQMSVLVRFPNRKFRKQVNPDQSDITSFIRDSLNYADENYRLIQELAPNLSKFKRNNLLDTIIHKRLANKPALSPDYLIKHIDIPGIAVTPIVGDTTEDLISRKNIPMNSFSRYSWCVRHFPEISDDENSQEVKFPYASMTLDENGDILYSYQYEEEGKQLSLPMTILEKSWGSWKHTDPETIQALQKHLEDLQQEIVNFPLDMSDPKSKKAFFEKVARGYWLVATLSETHRGTPHNAMMWLNLVYEHFHLPPPIPKHEHFFLDNTMLVIPWEKAVEDWGSYFEPCLDEALSLTDHVEKQQFIKKLLTINGLALKLCSEAIRAKRQLVMAAIKQNPEALKYASIQLQTDLR